MGKKWTDGKFWYYCFVVGGRCRWVTMIVLCKFAQASFLPQTMSSLVGNSVPCPQKTGYYPIPAYHTSKQEHTNQPLADTVLISPQAQLVARLRAGDAASFTEIYRLYAEKLVNYTFNILQDKDTCRDIIHDIFLSLWLNRQALDITNTLEAYLYGAARLKVFETIRKGKVREGVFQEIERRIWGEPVADSLLEQRELQSRLASAISDLPEKAREVYRLSREGHLSHRQIAERLGISDRTVENHLAAALKKIRAGLSDLLPLIILFLGGK